MSARDERGSVRRPALSRLVGAAADDFGARYWSVGPLLSRSDELGEDFSDLFSADAVDELVAERAIRTPFVRMANEGTVLTSSRYTASGGFGAEIGDQLSSEKVLEEYAAGSTLVLQGLHRTWEPLATFTRQLVADLRHPCQVNAYITPAASRGFDPHYDVHDVFVVQVHGEKHWTIHAPVHQDPLSDQPWTDHRDAVATRALEQPAIDATLRPGDVLYLPRGWIHSATALGDTSIHLTLGVAALTRYEIVERVLAAAAQEPGLRQSLPLGFDASSPELESIVGDTVRALQQQLSAPGDLESTVAQRLDRRLRDSIRPEPVRPLATIDALGAMIASTRVQWRGGLSARVEQDDSGVRIVLGSKTVSLPLECAAALDRIRDGRIERAGELADLDADSSLVVARRLVREGVLVVR
ncbi:cupin domain-containing protein [Planctomonas psychrotolerans]|uniref:cupin domain-containing protein n=1 Tax=Planctomonas psychrotolerans TaxID=2528712 RepID=UPI00123A974F|nr:cupin domain-containing protein [Planctomonas psychrotolerans]